MNTAILATSREAILDDLATVLEAHPETAAQLALDLCRRLALKLNGGELDALRFEMHQKKECQPGGETGLAGTANEAATSFIAILP